jgi:hypothetical protein
LGGRGSGPGAASCTVSMLDVRGVVLRDG